MYQGDELNYKSFIKNASDNSEGDLTEKVKYTEIDTSLVGEQKIVYSISDSSGNLSQEIVKVNILDNAVPIEDQQQSPPPKNDNQKIEVIDKNELLENEKYLINVNQHLPFLADLCHKLKYYTSLIK